jgi:hypothetical protein
VVREHCQRIYDAGTREGVTQEERYAISQDPENRRWKAEFEQILKEKPEEFCERIERALILSTLGKNLFGRDLGPEELRTKLARTELFIAKYNIQVHGPHEVSFVLPKGVSRYEMLCEAHEIVAERDGRDLVYPPHLQNWAHASAFTLPCTTPERIRIDGHVEGGDEKTRHEQEAFLVNKGLQQAKLEDLAAASVAHYVATGTDLFENLVVRAVGGALYFNCNGVEVYDIDDDSSFSGIAVASRALPASAEPTAGKPGLKTR